MCRWIMPAVAYKNRSCFIVWGVCSSNESTHWIAVRTSTSFFINAKLVSRLTSLRHTMRPTRQVVLVHMYVHDTTSFRSALRDCTCVPFVALSIFFSRTHVFFFPPQTAIYIPWYIWRFSILLQGFFAKPETFRSMSLDLAGSCRQVSGLPICGTVS